ncbi:MAG: alginate export family protein [Lentisphaeraceae bacterium]|nr:alginate export family protein [Lentisphaeraceae bacterium]
MKLKKLLTVALVGLLSLQLTAIEKVDNLGDFFTKGTYELNMRLGYEYSDLEDNGAQPGKGLTLSSYIGYRTAEYEGVSFYGEFHNMWKIWDEYNDLRGKFAGANDVIADPDGSRLQQMYMDLNMIPDTNIRIGRQAIKLDDVHFIGDIIWRNTAQTFDAVSLTNKSIEDTTIFLAYSDNVASILFKENEYDGIYMANVKYTGIKDHTQTGFAYLVNADENENVAGPSIAHDVQTYGTRLTGGFDALKYDFTYAYQSDWQDSESIDASLIQGSLAYKMGDFTPAISYAYHQGSDEAGGKGFANLFSTAHKFNGWSDQFLGTNSGALSDGLQDFNASLTYKKWGMTFKAVYHYFDTTESHTYDGAYGQEIDFVVVKPINENLTALAKLAYYDADSEKEAFGGVGSKDELVFWLRLDYKLQGKITDPFNM